MPGFVLSGAASARTLTAARAVASIRPLAAIARIPLRPGFHTQADAV